MLTSLNAKHTTERTENTGQIQKAPQIITDWHRWLRLGKGVNGDAQFPVRSSSSEAWKAEGRIENPGQGDHGLDPCFSIQSSPRERDEGRWKRTGLDPVDPV